MPLFIVKQDITKMEVDAVVNPANPTLLGGGGLDGEIHRAAGPSLLKKCKTLGGCATGEAKITKGYDLPAKYIIHTVGPVWQGGNCGEEELLYSCYRNSLELVASKRCRTVAIPVISAGAYGYPYDRAAEAAKLAILEFLNRNDGITVYLVMRERRSPEKSRLYSQIEYYMMQNGISSTDNVPDTVLSKCLTEPLEYDAYSFQAQAEDVPPYKSASKALPTIPLFPAQSLCNTKSGSKKRKHDKHDDIICGSSEPDAMTASMSAMPSAVSPAENSFEQQNQPTVKPKMSQGGSLEDMLRKLDKSFSETLLELIDDSGMTDSECYKRANIDRKLFSKIRKDKNYKPSKPTVLAFAIALRLDIDNTKMLLERAGFALSPSSKFDMIIQYFITHGIYDVFEINDALFAFDQNLLGA